MTPKLYLATRNKEIYLKDETGIHLLPIEGTKITFREGYLWSMNEDSLWKLKVPVDSRAEGPYSHFLDKGLVNIHPTGGGILTITNKQTIYYVNPSGEFFLLQNLQLKVCKQEGVILFDARPPFLLFKHKEKAHFFLVNTDYPEDYIQFYEEAVGLARWDQDIAIVFKSGRMMFVSHYITTTDLLLSGRQIQAFCEFPLPERKTSANTYHCCMRDYCFTCCETDGKVKHLRTYKDGSLLSAEIISLDIIDITFDPRDSLDVGTPPTKM